MSKLKIPDVCNVETLEDIIRFTAICLLQIQDVVNGNISFKDNCDTAILSANFTVANQDLQLTHGLKRVPIGYILVGASTPMSLYNGATPSTVTDIYLKSNAIGSGTVLVF